MKRVDTLQNQQTNRQIFTMGKKYRNILSFYHSSAAATDSKYFKHYLQQFFSNSHNIFFLKCHIIYGGNRLL